MIDKNTGLPEVPEGYFWRVKKFNYDYSRYTVDVQLRHRIWGGFSTEVANLLAEGNAESILNAALTVLRMWGREINAQAKRDEREQFIGDYPPKRLS